MPDQPACRIAIEDCVAVNTDQDFILRGQCAGAQSQRLALIAVEMNHSELVGDFRQFREDLSRIIGAGIVDRDDLEIGIVLLQQSDDGVPYVLALVVAGNNECDAGRLFKLGRIIDGPFLDTFAIEKVVNSTRHPQVRHEQRVVEGEVEEAQDNRLETHRPVSSKESASEMPWRIASSSGCPAMKSSG